MKSIAIITSGIVCGLTAMHAPGVHAALVFVASLAVIKFL